MSLTAIHLKQFTAFADLRVEFSPGINVLVGANGVGKTHLMKAAYASMAGRTSDAGRADHFMNVFMPSGWGLERLLRHADGIASGSVGILWGNETSRIDIDYDPDDDMTEWAASGTPGPSSEPVKTV